MSFTDPRRGVATLLRKWSQQPGGRVEVGGGVDGDVGGVMVVVNVVVGGGEEVGGSVVVGGGEVVGGSVVVGGGDEVGGSLVLGVSDVGGGLNNLAVPAYGAQPPTERHQCGGLEVVCPPPAGGDVIAVVEVGALVEVIEGDTTGAQTLAGSPFRLTPPPSEPLRSVGRSGAAPLTSGERPKIKTRTRTQTDTAPIAITAGVDRDTCWRNFSRGVNGAGGGATTTRLRLLRATTAHLDVDQIAPALWRE